MEAAAIICFYSFFCCAICANEEMPLSSNPKITVNPVVSGGAKGVTVKNEP